MAKKTTKHVHINVTSNVNGLTKKTNVATDKMSGGFKKAKGSAGAFSGAMKGLSTRVMGFIKHPAVLLAAAVAGIVKGFGAALRVAEGFSSSMSKLSAISGATGSDLEDLQQNAEQLGKSTQFTAAQVADAQTELAKMGFTTTGILNATSGAIDLAVSSGIEMADAAEMMASTMNGFGFETSEAGRIVDVMAKSFTTSALDADKFRESMKLVAPIAKTTKVSLEESAAALGVLANQGISGSMAGTQLRRIMSELAKKTGKNFRDSLTLTADKLANATSTSEKLAIATDLVGDRAKGSLIALVENQGALDELTGKYKDAGGAAADMVGIMEDNLSGDKKKMRSAIEGLGITISRVFKLEEISRFFTKTWSTMVTAMELSIGRFGLKMERAGVRFDQAGSAIGMVIDTMRLKFLDLKATIADIPIIGKVIDKSQLDKDRAALRESFTKRAQDFEKYGERVKEINTDILLYGTTTTTGGGDDDAPIGAPAPIDEFIESDVDGEGEDQANKLAKLQDFLNKQSSLIEDHEDSTHLAKMERMRDRALEEAELLGANEEQLATIRQGYQDRIDSARAKDVEDTRKAQQEKIDAKLEELDIYSRIFGEESKMGKVLLLAKAQMAKVEMQIDGEVTMSKMLKATAEAGVDYFKGIGKAASAAPFPLNIPLIAGHVATALPMLMSLKSIFKSSKSSAKLSGGTPSLPSGASGGGITPPSFNVVGQASAGEQMIANTIGDVNKKPQKAYVVSSEISNSQELDRKAEDTASIG